MAMYTIEINETFNVPRKKVFALFADHQRFGKMLGAPVKRIKDSDQADPNGLGSVRKIGIGPLSLEETVLNFEPDTLIEYAITSMSPIKNHLGRIRFSDTPDGQTQLNYTITFEDIVPFSGKVVSVALEQGLRRGIKRVPKLA
ncbi:SRPBCC family protein [Marinobacter shengliensis]|uniref:SRPBCC family protein n=1 Tax=Marinobacter shengliensis TaxID=1389223 RepID=UPI001109548D|nr:SRPBCC family protein [Marinobacter shengliensis]